jgi:AmmeMemoRadiSam system protein A
MIDGETRRRLLAVAREHLEARVYGHAVPTVPGGLVVAAAGVFVTLYCRDELRGCLGSLESADPLAHSVARLAAAVCREDHRFDPLRPDELAVSIIELSVLTPPARVADLATIQIGRHGLIAERGQRKGLLLPQVAPEHGWDRERFLTCTCLKAGLAGDAWKNDAVIYAFEAEVFGERAHRQP